MVPPNILKDHNILNTFYTGMPVYFLTCAPEILGIDYSCTTFNLELEKSC